jgi:hypothetical protein
MRGVSGPREGSGPVGSRVAPAAKGPPCLGSGRNLYPSVCRVFGWCLGVAVGDWQIDWLCMWIHSVTMRYSPYSLGYNYGSLWICPSLGPDENVISKEMFGGGSSWNKTTCSPWDNLQGGHLFPVTWVRCFPPISRLSKSFVMNLEIVFSRYFISDGQECHIQV